MLDGNNTYPTRDLSPFYMTCLGDRTVSVGICRFGVYDPTLKSCTTELSPGNVSKYQLYYMNLLTIKELYLPLQGSGDILFFSLRLSVGLSVRHKIVSAL